MRMYEIEVECALQKWYNVRDGNERCVDRG